MSSLAPAIADLANRVGTWGMDPTTRAENLAERRSDLDDQLADPDRNRSVIVIGRSLRSLLHDVGSRISAGKVTAIPASIALLFAGAGAVVFALRPRSAADLFSLLINGAGILTLAIAGLQSPRVIRKHPVAAGAIMITVGSTIGMAAIPVTEQTSLFDLVGRAGFGLTALGFGGLSISLLVRPRALPLAGMLIVAAAVLVAFANIGWSIAAANDLAWLGSLLIAIAGILAIRSLSRLRHLPVQ